MCFAGTPWWPDLENRILFVELSDSAVEWQVWRALHQLVEQPGFSQLSGIALGWVPTPTGIDVPRLHDYLAALVRPFGIPAAVDLPFGHADPILSFEQGAPVRMDCNGKRLELSFASTPQARDRS